ncbi:MAG: oligopeptide/dipeptide ABC transporter ATP-binding protein [Myxococcota bacterium]
MTDLLRVDGLSTSYPVRRGFFRREVGRVRAVDSVTLNVQRGTIFAVVGESGSGKTTLARSILRLVEPDAGRVEFDGVSVRDLESGELRRLRKRMQMVFQDPASSLNPRLTVEETLLGPMRAHGIENRSLPELLEKVGLEPEHLKRYPHEFSGGQRQRIGIARAIAVEPELIIADEPVSALDVSVQSQILNLFLELQKKLSLSYVFIAHDLSVVRHLADRIAVMYLGRLVEVGRRDQIFNAPRHPYTRSLLSAVPRLGARPERIVLAGEVPSPISPPGGCALHPRCPLAMDRCRIETPRLREPSEDGHQVACHFDRIA